MRVLTWNMAYMKPGRYKGTPNRRRQWALLAAIAPDIALLQECRPSDLASLAPAWMVDEYELVGTLPSGQVAGSAVLARRQYRPAPLDPGRVPKREQRWHDFFAGYVSAATLTLEHGEVTVASVHALAGEVTNPAITPADHAATKRPSPRSTYYNDLAAAALRPLTTQTSFVIGGDWNISLLFDTAYPSVAPASAEFFAARASDGWHHALRKFEPREVRTYTDPKSGPYELDHLFTDPTLHSALTSCHVVSDEAFRLLSDHAPVLAEFRSTGSMT